MLLWPPAMALAAVVAAAAAALVTVPTIEAAVVVGMSIIWP